MITNIVAIDSNNPDYDFISEAAEIDNTYNDLILTESIDPTTIKTKIINILTKIKEFLMNIFDKIKKTTVGKDIQAKIKFIKESNLINKAKISGEAKFHENLVKGHPAPIQFNKIFSVVQTGMKQKTSDDISQYSTKLYNVAKINPSNATITDMCSRNHYEIKSFDLSTLGGYTIERIINSFDTITKEMNNIIDTGKSVNSMISDNMNDLKRKEHPSQDNINKSKAVIGLLTDFTKILDLYYVFYKSEHIQISNLTAIVYNRFKQLSKEELHSNDTSSNSTSTNESAYIDVSNVFPIDKCIYY